MYNDKLRGYQGCERHQGCQDHEGYENRERRQECEDYDRQQAYEDNERYEDYDRQRGYEDYEGRQRYQGCQGQQGYEDNERHHGCQGYERDEGYERNERCQDHNRGQGYDEYQGCEEYEDMYNVRGFQDGEDDGQINVIIENGDIKGCNSFDNTDYIDIDEASYSRGSCNNYAEFIITNLEKNDDEEPYSDACNVGENHKHNVEDKRKCNVYDRCNINDKYNRNDKYDRNDRYNENDKCRCMIEDRCKDNYDNNVENCSVNYECKQKNDCKKPRSKKPCRAYKKGLQVGYRMGYIRAQQEFRKRIMYMYNIFQCR